MESRHGAADVAEVNGEELALGAETTQRAGHVAAGLLQGAQAEEQAHARIGVAVEQDPETLRRRERLGHAAVDRQRRIIGMEAQPHAGGAGHGQDGVHEAVEAAPDFFGSGDAWSGGAGARPR